MNNILNNPIGWFSSASPKSLFSSPTSKKITNLSKINEQ